MVVIVLRQSAMNTDSQLKALAAAVMLVFAGIGGVAGTVAAQSSGNTTQSAGNVAVGVDQAGNYEVTVTVTSDGSAVEGATVDVTSDSAYAGTGSYQTGADGTVTLPAPAEPTSVTVVASGDDWSTEPVSAELESKSFMNFGQRVSYFVHGLLDGTDSEGGIGQFVSEFVKKNNPSNDNKPDHAGKPEHAGGPDKANNGKPEQAGGPDKANNGKPEQAGGPDKANNGKPEHAGGPDKSNEEKSDDASGEDGQDDETPDEETDTRGNGPGGDGHPGNGNGNGKK